MEPSVKSDMSDLLREMCFHPDIIAKVLQIAKDEEEAVNLALEFQENPALLAAQPEAIEKKAEEAKIQPDRPEKPKKSEKPESKGQNEAKKAEEPKKPETSEKKEATSKRAKRDTMRMVRITRSSSCARIWE